MILVDACSLYIIKHNTRLVRVHNVKQEFIKDMLRSINV